MKIAIDVESWVASPKIESVIAVPWGDEVPVEYRFMLPGRSDVVTAVVTDEGTKIDIQPERSAGHRALRDALQS